MTVGSQGSICIIGAGFIPNHCGCTTAAECPYANACDTNAKTCGLSCGMANQTPCNGGCCDGAGTGGTFQCLSQPRVPQNTSCGNTGQFCQDCTANVLPMCTMGGPAQTGRACINMDTCGCNTTADCAGTCMTCNANHQCVF